MRKAGSKSIFNAERDNAYRPARARAYDRLQLEHLIRLRQIDSSVAEMCCQAVHRFFFAVNEERPLRTGLLLPSQQLSLICMGRETVDRVDASSHRDLSGWFEAYLGGRWYTFDARHNKPRIARILKARGRDATDVAIVTTFGPCTLGLITEEVTASTPVIK